MSEKIILIKYKSAITSTHINALVSEGGDIKHVVESINGLVAKVPVDNIDLLKSDPDVEYIEEESFANIQVIDLPAEERTATSMAGQTIPWGISKIRAPDVWKSGNKGIGLHWAIIDTGIYRSHPDLASNIEGGYNFIDKTYNFDDDNGHGTHVSGTVAAIDNDTGVVGVAPQVDLFGLKVLDSNGSGSYFDIIAAIDWCINNPINGINMSLGGTSPSQGLRDACAAAYKAGIVIVAAAGNSGGNGTTDTVLYPAKYTESVIAVAATDINDARASFSSCGSEVEVSGPGVSILSTVPPSGTKYSDPSGEKELSGTSMGAPHVSGTSILILKSHPEFRPADVRAALDKSAVDLGTPGKDVFYGNGRIDAKAAVDLTPPPPPQPPVLTKITVSPSISTVIIGKTQQFKATALDQNNNVMPSVSISWALDKSIGTIEPSSGVTGPDGAIFTTFTATSADTAILTASSGNISGSSSVTVEAPSSTPVLTKIVISPPSASLVVGSTQKFSATALDQNNNPMANVVIGWMVATNPAAGKVNPIYSPTDADGIATTTFVAVNAGTCSITASNGNVGASVQVTVNNPPPTPVKSFKVVPLGIPGHYMGVLIQKLPFGGDSTSDEACAKACALLKQM